MCFSYRQLWKSVLCFQASSQSSKEAVWQNDSSIYLKLQVDNDQKMVKQSYALNNQRDTSLLHNILSIEY